MRKLARTLLAAERPADDSPREIHRFRRRTEPWALAALAFLGATDLDDAVRAARAADPPEPLLRGEDVLELGVGPGPEVGRLLELVAEERGNVVSVEHHREGMAIHVSETEVELTVVTRNEEHCRDLCNAMEERGYPVERMR